jgi:hypothetical protein
VVTEQMGKICLIGINRPEKRNAVNIATAQQLITAFKSFENDDSVHVAVLHGKGKTRCHLSISKNCINWALTADSCSLQNVIIAPYEHGARGESITKELDNSL